jgi:hypothetical protein
VHGRAPQRQYEDDAARADHESARDDREMHHVSG